MNKKVLVVDPASAHCDSLRRCLIGLDVDVVQAKIEDHALQWVCENEPVFIATALDLPEMDGIELARIIRSDRQNHHIPIIILAGAPQWERVMYRALEAGIVDHFSVPLQRGIVSSRVRIFVELHAGRQEQKKHERLMEESNHEFRDFAHAAAHDLRAPIRTIGSFAAELNKPGLDAEQRERDLIFIQNASTRMSKMLDDMLEYAQVRVHSTPKESVELDQALRDVVADLGPAFSETSAQIRIDPLPRITGCASQLRRLFQNLISNAIKYRRPEVPPEIRVSCALADSTVKIDVADNGMGFDMRWHDQAFEPFRRLLGSESVQGSGVGLASAKRIVERHGGQLSATSEVGKGSTFHVRIPISMQQIASFRRTSRSLTPLPSEAPEAVTTKFESPASADSPSQRQATAAESAKAEPTKSEPEASAVPNSEPRNTDAPLRVLVVDDCEIDREWARRAIGKTSQAVYASSAEEGLSKVDGTFSIVVSDFNMPGNNGLWLLSQVAERHPQVYRLLLTGQMNDHCTEALASGVITRVLQKPIARDELQEILSELEEQ